MQKILKKIEAYKRIFSYNNFIKILIEIFESGVVTDDTIEIIQTLIQETAKTLHTKKTEECF